MHDFRYCFVKIMNVFMEFIMNLGCMQGLATCMGNCFRWLSPRERAKARQKETDAMLYDLIGGDKLATELQNRPTWSLPSKQVEDDESAHQDKLSRVYEMRERITQEILPQAAQRASIAIVSRKISVINGEPYENPDITEV